MKLMLVALLASLSLFHFCNSLDDDYKEPDGATVGASKEGGAATGRVNDGEPDHDPMLDQEALLGGATRRRVLLDMPKEEALKEIRKLVERIDTNTDGQLDHDELFIWLNKVEDKAFRDEAASVFTKEDTNDDGYVTVEEYIANSGMSEFGEGDETAAMQEDVRLRFGLADDDKDGRLSQSEFSAFAHPNRHEKMLEHLVEEQLSQFDKDTDERISFDEYMKYYNPSEKPMDEMPEWIVNEQREFEDKLDTNKDGYLDKSEIRTWIAPNDEEFFNEEIDHLLNNIDENKDNKLSYDEVLAQFEVLAESPLTDYGHTVHEEL